MKIRVLGRVLASTGCVKRLRIGTKWGLQSVPTKIVQIKKVDQGQSAVLHLISSLCQAKGHAHSTLFLSMEKPRTGASEIDVSLQGSHLESMKQ